MRCGCGMETCRGVMMDDEERKGSGDTLTERGAQEANDGGTAAQHPWHGRLREQLCRVSTGMSRSWTALGEKRTVSQVSTSQNTERPCE